MEEKNAEAVVNEGINTETVVNGAINTIELPEIGNLKLVDIVGVMVTETRSNNTVDYRETNSNSNDNLGD